MPRLRPPYPAECGLWGKPTSVNNVETYALVPWIFRHGAAAFARLGTEQSKGTKVFALAGKVRRGGLIEVPMGITVRQIVEEIGGGVAGGQTLQGGADRRALGRLRAGRTGRHAGRLRGPGRASAPSWAPAAWSCWTIATAWSTSPATSSASPRTSPAASARFCRIGTRRMLRHPRSDLRRPRQGAATWKNWSNCPRAVGAASICGLGRTAPNPVLSTLRYFRHGIRGPPGGPLPGGQVQGPDRLSHQRRSASAARSAPSSARPTPFP